jgi:hypothetical protein
MSALAILLLIVQIGFAIHVVKTGRELYWILIILILPLLGCIIYFVTQVLPDMQNSRTVRNAGNTLLKAVDPQRELRRRRDELEMTDTLDNRLKLADECLEAGMSQDALDLIQSCLKGLHADDPYILLKLAQAQFDLERFAETRETLDRLITANPDFQSHDGHLLYARSLEETGEEQQALLEYEALATAYPGEEARARYGLLLQKHGQPDKAQQVFSDMLLRAKRAPVYYRKKERQWLKVAEQHAE